MKRRGLAALPAALICLTSRAGLAQSRPAGDSAAVQAVVESVRGTGPLLCELAARTVEQNGGWGGPLSFDLRAPDDPAVRAALVAIKRDDVPPNAVPILSAALGDEDACVRRVAAPLLGRIENPAALMALRQALRDSRPGTREAAAIGMGYANNHTLIPALLAGIQDSVARVRVACVIALGEIEDKRAMGALVGLLRRDPDGTVRAAAAWAIGAISG
ncbi:MAG TPA: HEAT repeat domain-containing protein [Gemmatimonadales bacterium]|jgi:HEAT repeat protein